MDVHGPCHGQEGARAGNRQSVLWGGGVVTGGQAFETINVYPQPGSKK